MAYPRFGQRIAPASLREILDIPVQDYLTGKGVRLCDLDETAWSRWGPEACGRLAIAVVDRVRSVVANPTLPEEVRSRLLPALPQGIKLTDLELEVRTFNCLAKAGFLDRRHELGSQTVGDILGIRAFGAKCLVDLLTALESLTEQHGGQPPAQTTDPATYLLSKVESSISAFRAMRRDLRLELRVLQAIPHVDVIGGDDPRLGRLYRALGAGFVSLPQLQDYVVARLQSAPAHDLLGKRLRQLRQRLGKISRAALEIEELVGSPRGLRDYITGFEREAVDALLAVVRPLAALTCDMQHLPAKLRELREQIASLSEANLEEEIADILTAARGRSIDPRHMSILARRIGLDGNGGCTLETAAREFGTTRERVRQICSVVLEHLDGKKPFAPALDKSLSLVCQELPRDAEEIENTLAAHGLTGAKFRLEGLANLAELLGRQVDFTITNVGSQRFAVALSNANFTRLANLTVQAARRSVGHWGAATVDDIVAQVAEAASLPGDRSFVALVARILHGVGGFSWLGAPGGWFWLRSLPRNRLLNQIRKILSVSPRIHVSELRAGVGRHHRMKGFSPPRRVLLELCRQAPGQRVEDDTVVADPPLGWKKVLRRTEQTIVAVLKEHGPVMDRPRFEDLCLSRGMKKGTFYVFLDYSPVITKLGPGVYALVGAEVPPGTVESLAPKRQVGRVLVDYGWTPERRIWLGYRLSGGMISSGTFTVAAAMKPFVEGEFDLQTADGTRVGRVVSKKNGAWGLGVFFRRRGGEPGDYLLLAFDLAARVAVVSIGSASLLSELQTSGDAAPVD